MMAGVRFNVQFDEDVLKYLDDEAKRIGVSRSGMLSFMLEQYRTQRESIAMVGQVQELIKTIENSSNFDAKA